MPLGEASDLGCGAVDPFGGVVAAQELGVLEGSACGWVDDGVGVVKNPLEVGDVGGRIGCR